MTAQVPNHMEKSDRLEYNNRSIGAGITEGK